MIFYYFSEHVNFLARKVHISEKCDPRTEALHSKNNYNSRGVLTLPETCTRTRFWSIFRTCYISNWKRMILQHRFQASRGHCRFSSWKIAFYWNQVKMHSKIDYSESLKILGNSSVFFFRNCRIYSHDPHLSGIVTFLTRKTRFQQIPKDSTKSQRTWDKSKLCVFCWF